MRLWDCNEGDSIRQNCLVTSVMKVAVFVSSRPLCSSKSARLGSRARRRWHGTVGTWTRRDGSVYTRTRHSARRCHSNLCRGNAFCLPDSHRRCKFSQALRLGLSAIVSTRCTICAFIFDIWLCFICEFVFFLLNLLSLITWESLQQSLCRSSIFLFFHARPTFLFKCFILWPFLVIEYLMTLNDVEFWNRWQLTG